MQLTKHHILDYLQRYNLMQVATYGDDHPWIASLYYSYDDKLNLYFLSSPTTIHCQQIAANPQVAVAITDSHQALTANKKGLQMHGTAKQISSAAKVKHALRLWKEGLHVEDDELTYENMAKKIISGRMYQITPQAIKFFNQELFDVADGEEPMLTL